MKSPIKVLSNCLEKLAILRVLVQAVAEGASGTGQTKWNGQAPVTWVMLGNRS